VVTELQTAVIKVGLDAVRTVSYSLAVEQIIRSKHMMPFQALSQKIWEHSLAVAAIARILAKRVRMNSEKAFFLGMVHDIGAFYLVFRCVEDAVLASDREQLIELIFQWHDGIGHALLSAMSQPEDILIAVQDHEAATAMSSIGNWTSLVSCSDWLGQRLSDWVPEELRAPNPRTIATTLLNDNEQAEILVQAKEDLASLRAALF
jgi:putative nucleotidyltransferase with HDIG domain